MYVNDELQTVGRAFDMHGYNLADPLDMASAPIETAARVEDYARRFDGFDAKEVSEQGRAPDPRRPSMAGVEWPRLTWRGPATQVLEDEEEANYEVRNRARKEERKEARRRASFYKCNKASESEELCEGLALAEEIEEQLRQEAEEMKRAGGRSRRTSFVMASPDTKTHHRLSFSAGASVVTGAHVHDDRLTVEYTPFIPNVDGPGVQHVLHSSRV